jgi:hypothetical protein
MELDEEKPGQVEKLPPWRNQENTEHKVGPS